MYILFEFSSRNPRLTKKKIMKNVIIATNMPL